MPAATGSAAAARRNPPIRAGAASRPATIARRETWADCLSEPRVFIGHAPLMNGRVALPRPGAELEPCQTIRGSATVNAGRTRDRRILRHARWCGKSAPRDGDADVLVGRD